MPLYQSVSSRARLDQITDEMAVTRPLVAHWWQHFFRTFYETQPMYSDTYGSSLIPTYLGIWSGLFAYGSITFFVNNCGLSLRGDLRPDIGATFIYDHLSTPCNARVTHSFFPETLSSDLPAWGLNVFFFDLDWPTYYVNYYTPSPIGHFSLKNTLYPQMQAPCLYTYTRAGVRRLFVYAHQFCYPDFVKR